MTLELHIAAVALRGMLALVALVAILRFMWLPTIVTGFRQRLFAIRGDLFLYMADGKIEPPNPAYIDLRSTLNGLIRFADRITFSRVILGAAAMHEQGEEYRARVNQFLDALQPDVRDHLRSLWNRIDREIMLQIAATSPIAWIAVGVYMVCKLLSLEMTALTRVRALAVNAAEVDAYSGCEELT